MQSADWNDNNSNEDFAGTNKAGQPTGLASLFGCVSLTSDNRSLPEVDETVKILKEKFEAHKTSTTDKVQLQLIPNIDKLTQLISPNLPGITLSTEIAGNLYIMVALFSNEQLNIVSKRINMFADNGGNGQFGNVVSSQLTPVAYANKELVANITKHYKSKGSVKNVIITNMNVIDLEMYNHSEIIDKEHKLNTISQFIAREWEESILVQVAIEETRAGNKLMSPYRHPEKPYGKHNAVDARVNVIESRLNTAGHVSASNMEVVVATANPDTFNIAEDGNSREVARVRANVSLIGRTYENWVARQSGQMDPMAAMMGDVFGGYRPLHPLITIEQCAAGDMLNNNGGLIPFFYGLYALMCTNVNYVFAEPLRRITARGSLADLEHRINQLKAISPGTANAMASHIALDDKKMSDTDFVGTWIKQNIAKHATFQVNLFPSGANSSVNNFLVKLADKTLITADSEQVATLVNILDALSNNEFSRIVKNNVASGKGWKFGDPILHQTNTIAVNGLTQHAGKYINIGEFDEMMLCNISGKNVATAAKYMQTAYGGQTKETLESRRHRTIVQLKESMFSNKVHVNATGVTCIWDPEFMSVLGKAMSKIGSINASGSYGSWTPEAHIFAPGAGLATTAYAGNDMDLNSVLGTSNYY